VSQGITNPAEPFFKDGQWGWDGTVWRKLPMIFGYSDAYHEPESSLTGAAGDRLLTASTVPEGEVWVVTSVIAFNIDSATTNTRIQIYDGSGRAVVFVEYAPAAKKVLGGHCNIVMKKDDRLEAKFFGCALDDDIYMYINGYKMKVEE